MMLGLDPIQPHSTQGSGEASDRDVGSILPKLVVTAGQPVFNVVVRYQKTRGAGQRDRIPLEIRRLDRSWIEPLLVFQNAPHRSGDESAMLLRMWLDGGAARRGGILIKRSPTKGRHIKARHRGDGGGGLRQRHCWAGGRQLTIRASRENGGSNCR